MINDAREDFAQTVLALTNGLGADAVYDAAGKDTFENSLRALKPRGTLVSFGQASGDIGSYEIGKLASRSVTLSRSNYSHYTDTREAVLMHGRRFFEAVREGAAIIGRPRVFPLQDAAAAHRAIEGRRGVGSIVLSA